MSKNRYDHIKLMNEASAKVFREKGYISFVDVLLEMEILTKEGYESWRFRKVPCLEEVIAEDSTRVQQLLRTFQENCRRGGLVPSRTAYLSWGSGKQMLLRFGKTGNMKIEEAFATHFVKPLPKEGE